MNDIILNLLIEDNPEAGSSKDEQEEESLIPKYFSQLELSDEQKDDITREILDELEAIESERRDENFENMCDAMDAQYYGKLETTDLQFDVHTGLTADVVDTIVNRICKAIFDNDPKFSVSPRPEFAVQGMYDSQDVCQMQEDYLDYMCDDVLPLRREVKKAVRNAVLKRIGWLKFEHLVDTQKVKREEVYQGDPHYFLVTQQGKAEISEKDALAAMKQGVRNIEYVNQGLQDFVSSYLPASAKDAAKKATAMKYARRLKEGKKINILVEYDEPIYNDVFPTSINPKNLFCRMSCETYEDLAKTQLVAELKEYTWWELQQLKKKPYIYADAIDSLIYENEEAEKQAKPRTKYRNEKYEIYHCVFFATLEDGEEPVKCEIDISKDRRKMIGAKYYPYYAVSSKYLPMRVVDDEGLAPQAVGERLTGPDITIDVIVNYILEAWYQANTITPITEPGSEIDQQFLERRWVHGMPLVKGKSEKLDFLNKYIQPPDINGGLALMQFIKGKAEDRVGVNSGISGKADPLDPSAPASKTIALISESKPDLAEYINALGPSINQIAYIILAMSYQIHEEGRAYRTHPQRVVQGNPFQMINRAQLKAKTNVQTQAYLFAFDELNAKRELIAFYQIIRQEPLFAQNPESVNKLLRTIAKAWHPQIRNQIDSILPTNDQVKQVTLQTALQATAGYVEAKIKTAKMLGQPLDFNPEELINTMMKYVKRVATPPTEEEIKNEQNSAAQPISQAS